MTTDAAGTPRPVTRIGPATFAWGRRTFVMGIVNVTPDSFSGDGLLTGGDPVAAAVAQARAMVAEGADLLDIGGESTRPGHAPVAAADEAARVIPVVAAIRAALPDIPISIDTTKTAVAEAALAAGANLLNDVSGTDPGSPLIDLAARHGVPIVLMHDRPEARDDHDVVEAVLTDLRAAVDRARSAGVPTTDILVDPGIGFGKTADDNIAVLHDLARLRELGQPVLLGTSRKSTIGRILDLPAAERLEGTLATTALGIAAGVDIVRVHDVRANVRAARVSDAIVRGTWHATEAGG